MVRKTKEEALLTRSGILDAAEHLFHANGVSGTSLQHIAQAAGVTRGAIYWHFKDKGDLFHAMMERVCLPMEESTAQLDQDGGAAPLKALREHVVGLFARIAGDAQVQRVFEIATHKVEYVGELSALRERHLSGRREYTEVLERALRAAQALGEVPPGTDAAGAAIGLHALIDGMIQNWMLDPRAFDLMAVGTLAVDLHLAGLAGLCDPSRRG
jgi:TetR/AcrR family acrAB operon transcriptional repressor